MLNVESSSTESDELRNMLSSARGRTNVAISMPEGIFHRAMSRKKSLVDDDLMNAFSLPPIPLDSDIESLSADNESSEEEKPDLPSSKTSKENLDILVSSAKEVQPAKKVSLLKSRSASAQMLNVPNRLGKTGRRLSLSNIMKNIEEDQVVTIDENGVSKLGSRRSSLPLVADFVRRSPKFELKPSLPNIDETKDLKQNEKELEKQKNFDHFKQRRFETISSSSSSSIEEESTEDRLQFPSDEADEDMALELNKSSPEDDPSKASNMNNEERKRKKSVKNVFKKSFFKSKRGTKKMDQSQPKTSSKSDEAPSRLYRRRPSRLEMGIPIEEVFSGIEFKKVERKSPPIAIKAEDEESEEIEDLDDLINKAKADELEKSTFDFEEEKLAKNFASLTSVGHNLERKKV